MNLSTICSPHLGCRLVDEGAKGSYEGEYEKMERVFEILGITELASREFATENMVDFNMVCENVPGVDYFSVGSRKEGRIMTELLRHGHDVTVKRKFGIFTDGVVMPKEAKWGNYLMTFGNDHLEVVGF